MNTVSSYEWKYEVVNFAAIHERKLLLGLKQSESSASEWVLLGGKKGQEEDDRQCLTRAHKEIRNDARKLLENTELFGAFVSSTPQW